MPAAALPVRRRATAQRQDGSTETRWLDEWRDEPAYVLLGDPGSGKSTCLAGEAAAQGVGVLQARFIHAGIEVRPGPDRPVFVDALDEVRGGGPAASHDALGAVARWLRDSGSPPFRIACREADWHGAADRAFIERAAPGGRVTTLHLEPLREVDILQILRRHAPQLGPPDLFLEQARRHGIAELLGNPLLLDLLIRAVTRAGARWPSSRMAVYKLACRQMAEESSVGHRSRQPLVAGHDDQVLDAAGLLCAMLLLSGRDAIALGERAADHDIDLRKLPAGIGLEAAAEALRSKLFTVVQGRAMPRHRSVAEYLGAQAIARRIAGGRLVLTRVLALMLGFDGKPVEALRGLFAWLATHLLGAARERLLPVDPLGFVLNGDTAELTRAQRLVVLHALADAAALDPWFRHGSWVEHPFGPLAVPDMALEIDAELSRPDRSTSWQVYVDCLFDALKHAPQPMPSLAPRLVQWVVDPAASDGVRLAAYDAWKRHAPPDTQPAQMRAWLDGLLDGSVPDPDDRLAGRLLSDAYPTLLQSDVLRHLRPRSDRAVIGEYTLFWNHQLVERTPVEQLAALADAWVERFPRGLPHGACMEAQRAAIAVLATVLEAAGDQVPTERLYDWLGIGLDVHGIDRADRDGRKRIGDWLQARPDTIKAVVRHAWRSSAPDEHGYRAFWQATQRLRGAALPADWLRWLMDLAWQSDDAGFVHWTVTQIALAVMDPPAGFDTPSIDEAAQWATELARRHPEARNWLYASWSVDLSDWRADEHQRQVRHRAEEQVARERRRSAFEPLLQAHPARPMPAAAMHQIALAFDDGFSDIDGDTPQQRVAELVGTTDIAAALRALDETLQRDDLPDVDQVLKLDGEGKEHFLRAPALLAARRLVERDADAWRSWSDELSAQLTALWLTYGAGEEPAWYRPLAANRPEVVAPVLVRIALARLRRKGPQAVPGLRALARDDSMQRLVELALPALLQGFPLRAHEHARDELNRSLLRALPRLDAAQAVDIVRHRLALSSLDAGQRIAWMVAMLSYDESMARDLSRFAAGRARRAAMLGQALRDQQVLDRTESCADPQLVATLIQALGPATPLQPTASSGRVSDADNREQTVKRLFERLGRNPSDAAGSALASLASTRGLAHWKPVAEHQLQAHVRLRRERQFHAPSPANVAHALAGGAPANALDLCMLVVDHLRQLEQEWRGAPEFQLRQFRHADGQAQDEAWCRDLLLAQLRPRLNRHGVDLQPESAAAGGKRADLRATAFTADGERISLVIELKKDTHPKVWVAWRDQLQALYTTDPSTDGVGLYVVFWFGERSKATPEGERALDAADAQARLERRIPEPDGRRLQVCVLDLSWPWPLRPAAPT